MTHIAERAPAAAAGPSGAGREAPGRRDRPPLWRELLLGLAVFGVYSAVAGLDWPERRATAAAHARAVFDLERRLHLDIEPALNSWLTRQDPFVRMVANYEYAITYIVSAFVLIFWIYVRRPDAYRSARTSFVLVNLLGVTCFALYPLMPPRLVPDQGFVDTVTLGHTWGSWGSPLVAHANQLAAMPSLHVAWAFWVSVVLARISGAWFVQTASAAHVLVTVFVIAATANHYMLDAVAGGVLVWACVVVAGLLGYRPVVGESRGERVPAADAFFLYVESPLAPQQVGGMVLLDTAGRIGGPPTREDLLAVVKSRLDALPRFRQRLSGPSRWHRQRWVDHSPLDWDWHVIQHDVADSDGRPGGVVALHALVAEMAAAPLPRDRPLWRFAVVHGVEPQRAAAVLVVHHVIADGIGTVAQALKFLEPVRTTGSASGEPTERESRPSRVRAASGARPGLPVASAPGRRSRDPGSRQGVGRTVPAIVVGLAQLATDGRPSGRLPGGATAQRRFGTVTLPLGEVRAVARRYGVRVSDVLLCGVAGGLHRILPAGAIEPSTRLRVAVPLMVRDPHASAEGNVTAAVMMDLPLAPLAESERLADIARRSNRLRTGTRALASRFVMQAVGEVLPPVAHAWFARTVYGGRFFQAIVSNMPGPDVQLALAGAPIEAAFPLLPLAPEAPLAVGALGWSGSLCLGISADPALTDDADTFGAAVRAAFDDLRRTMPSELPAAELNAAGAPEAGGA